MSQRWPLLAEALALLRPSWLLAALAAVGGLVAGVATTSLLAVINQALNRPDFMPGLWPLVLSLAGLCPLALGGQLVSSIGANKVGQAVVARVRRRLIARILAAPVARLERWRLHRLLTSLGQDVEAISGFAAMFAGVLSAAAIVAGCLCYLALLSPVLFILAISALGLGMLVGDRGRRRGRRVFEAARLAEDELQRHYRAITEGAKELKVSRRRRLRLLHHDLERAIEQLRQLRGRAFNIMAGVGAFNSLFYFCTVGGMLAWARTETGVIEPRILSSFILILLYMKGPVQQLMAVLPAFSRAQVAFARITELALPVPGEEIDTRLDHDPPPPPTPQTIRLEAVSYAFAPDDQGRRFGLGPLDLTIRRGEILFITGENGCGKTTLIKLLLNLYRPQAGRILIDGKPLALEAGDDYRQLFSVIFFDYFLFAEVEDKDLAGPEIARLLAAFELDGKVGIDGRRFHTTDLSSGQRKRLAMIELYLEDRPFLVFDEWAAEQDPSFRRLFYREILPDLKRRGKTIIAISHDDRYFDVADHHIVMKQGLIVSDRAPPPGC